MQYFPLPGWADPHILSASSCVALGLEHPSRCYANSGSGHPTRRSSWQSRTSCAMRAAARLHLVRRPVAARVLYFCTQCNASRGPKQWVCAVARRLHDADLLSGWGKWHYGRPSKAAHLQRELLRLVCGVHKCLCMALHLDVRPHGR